MRSNTPTPMAQVPFTSIWSHKPTRLCCRSPTTASASTPGSTRAPPEWGSASSPRWRQSSTPASNAIRPTLVPGSCCGSAASPYPPPSAKRPPGPKAPCVLVRTRFRLARKRDSLARMASRDSASSEITPEVLLRAYACGIFPMAESADDPTLFWVEPEMRGLIPLDGFHVASRLARTVRSDVFTVTVDTAFKAVIAGCAAPQQGRNDTWINKRIRDLYGGLFELGHAHSVEVWQDDDLVGGLYGVNLGRAFFGESMFHRARDASK